MVKFDLSAAFVEREKEKKAWKGNEKVPSLYRRKKSITVAAS